MRRQIFFKAGKVSLITKIVLFEEKCGRNEWIEYLVFVKRDNFVIGQLILDRWYLFDIFIIRFHRKVFFNVFHELLPLETKEACGEFSLFGFCQLKSCLNSFSGSLANAFFYLHGNVFSANSETLDRLEKRISIVNGNTSCEILSRIEY